MRTVVRVVVLLGILLLVAGDRRQPHVAAQTAPAFAVIATVAVPAGGAEVVSATPDGRYLAVTAAEAKQVALLDLTDPAAPRQVCVVDTADLGEPTSVAVHPSGAYAVTAILRDPAPGLVLAFSLPECRTLWQVPVGIGPDSVVITPNGQQAVVAIEDEETPITDPSVCPNERPGRVDLIELPPAPAAGPPTVRAVALRLDGIAGVTCPADPQPEGIAISPDSTLAYVTLQENNALATIDLQAGVVLSVVALGTTAHLADLTRDGMARVEEPFTGRREPDGIAISGDGRWLFTAEEGIFSGGRTMTVLRAATVETRKGERTLVEPPVVVTDSGDQIERTAAAHDALADSRAPSRGPEPEGVTVFRSGGREFAAVVLERSDAVIVFDVSDPLAPTAVAFLRTGVGPETVTYLPTRGLLVTANEVEGSITVICVQAGGCR